MLFIPCQSLNIHRVKQLCFSWSESTPLDRVEREDNIVVYCTVVPRGPEWIHAHTYTHTWQFFVWSIVPFARALFEPPVAYVTLPSVPRLRSSLLHSVARSNATELKPPCNSDACPLANVRAVSKKGKIVFDLVKFEFGCGGWIQVGTLRSCVIQN